MWHVQVSRLYLVDMPGAEQLLVDPHLLRQREGSQVNQSLLSFATTMRKLAQGNPAHTINQDASVLTKLLSGSKLQHTFVWQHFTRQCTFAEPDLVVPWVQHLHVGDPGKSSQYNNLCEWFHSLLRNERPALFHLQGW